MAFLCRAEVRILFPSEKHAKIAMGTLEVDKEIQPKKIRKSFTVEATELRM
jgi:hypothetical protein